MIYGNDNIHTAIEKVAGLPTGELTKISRVATAVKQYRRAMQILAEAGRPGTERAFHGTKPEYLQSILASGKIQPASGAHGKGTYLWKNRPRQSYMNTSDSRSPGFIMRRSKLGRYAEPIDPNPHKLDRRHMTIVPEGVKIPQRSTVKGTPQQLREGRKGIKKHRLRQVDSAIWTRSEADTAARRAGEDVIEPTKRELIRLLRQKDKPPKFKFVRSKPGTKESEKFLDTYYDALIR